MDTLYIRMLAACYNLIRAEPRVAECFCTYSLLYVAIYVPCFVASPCVVVDVVISQHLYAQSHGMAHVQWIRDRIDILSTYRDDRSN